jgi:uridine phosphorylase
MDFFDSESESMVNPREMVRLFTSAHGVTEEDLSLPPVAIVSFSPRVLRTLVQRAGGKRLMPWHGRSRWLYAADTHDRPVLLAQSPCGAPGAVILLEELFAFGVRRAVFVGYCGSIQEDVGIGEIVLPTRAIREEGTSYHYLPPADACGPDDVLSRRLDRWLQRHGVVARKGPVWTTDALYRETKRKIAKYREDGVLAVDMEMAAVFAVGKVRMREVVAVLLVSDRLSSGVWAPDFFDARLREREKFIVESILKWIEEEA